MTQPDVDDTGLVATTHKTTYLTTGTVLHVDHADDPAELGPLPELEQSLLLRRGDMLDVTRDCSPARVDGRPPAIGCTLGEVFDNARVGEKIHFDDGRITGEIKAVDRDVLRVRIERASAAGSRLRAGKGINVPDTEIAVSALTDKDVADLATAVEIADLVELSFVQLPSDVERLHEALAGLGGDHVGVVLKIETRRAFERLPQLLLTAMRRPRVGVMIARGDLAVEVGYERLAELQEEILWLCEAAHLPVIWATQVLEQLAKSGLPSRAEISDAAMGERAECVMLNKGPHIEDAVVVLDDILCRMAEHHYKKNALLRQLHSWRPSVWGIAATSPCSDRRAGPLVRDLWDFWPCRLVTVMGNVARHVHRISTDLHPVGDRMLESAVERRAGTTRHERRWRTGDLSSQLRRPAPHSAVPHGGGHQAGQRGDQQPRAV